MGLLIGPTAVLIVAFLYGLAGIAATTGVEALVAAASTVTEGTKCWFMVIITRGWPLGIALPGRWPERLYKISTKPVEPSFKNSC